MHRESCYKVSTLADDDSSDDSAQSIESGKERESVSIARTGMQQQHQTLDDFFRNIKHVKYTKKNQWSTASSSSSFLFLCGPHPPSSGAQRGL